MSQEKSLPFKYTGLCVDKFGGSTSRIVQINKRRFILLPLSERHTDILPSK